MLFVIKSMYFIYFNLKFISKFLCDDLEDRDFKDHTNT